MLLTSFKVTRIRKKIDKKVEDEKAAKEQMVNSIHSKKRNGKTVLKDENIWHS